MVCSSIFTIESIADLLVWPNGCDFYFYLKFFLGLLAILSWTIYKAEKKETQKSEFLSAIGVSSMVVLSLALIATLVTNIAGIPMVSSEVLLLILAVTIPTTIIWIWKK